MTIEQLQAKLAYDPHRKVRFSLDGKSIRIRKIGIAPDNSILVELADVKPRTKMVSVVYTYNSPKDSF
jgi:hypothetical protein